MHKKGTQDPESAARELFAALDERRSRDVAEFIHPDAAGEMKRNAILTAEHEEEYLEANRVFYDDPDRIKSPHDVPSCRRTFGVDSVTRLRALDPRELIIRYIEHRFTKTQTEESPLPEIMPASSYHVHRNVLGHAEESPDLAHVVYRVTQISRGREFSDVTVLTMRLFDDRWLSEGLGFLHVGWEGYPPAVAY